MKKHFNYIFIFVVCFVFIGEAKAYEVNRVSREDFEGAYNPFVLCGKNSNTGENVCKGSKTPTNIKVSLIDGNNEIELTPSPYSSSINNGNYNNIMSGITLIDRRTSLTKSKGWRNDKGEYLPDYYFVMIPSGYGGSILGEGGQIKKNVSIAVTYPKVAKYKNEFIDIKAIYTVYIYGNDGEHSALEEFHLKNYSGIIIGLPFNLRDVGTGFYHSAFNKVRYEFYRSDTGASVSLNKSKFLIKSLNKMGNEKNESAIIPKTMSDKVTSFDYVNKYLHTDECGSGLPNNLTFNTSPQSISFTNDNRTFTIDPGIIVSPNSDRCFHENGKDDNDLPIAIDFYVNAFAFWFNSNYVEYYLASYLGPNSDLALDGFNIMFTPSSGSEFKVPPTDYDYSIDMACTNCSSTLKSNKAIYVQDTTDWEAITNSGSSSCTNAENYFETENDSGIYCRSEYEIIYPNKDDIITVYTGRFFTLNATDDDYQRVVGTDKFVHNFKPISVTKKMECKGNIGGQENVLKDYFLNEGENDDESGGTIKLTYTDNKKKTYDFKDVTLKSKLDGEVSVSNSGGMITLLGKYYFTLPDDFYRYVQKKDAFSIRDYNTIKNNNPANYRDIEISNIPIPFNDHKTGDEVSTTFKYTLPTKSKIKEALKNEKSNYFGCPEDVQIDNLYKKAKAKNSNDMLKETACYKLFGKASLTDECVTDRLSKTINCLKDGYTCNLPVSDSKAPPCDPKKEVCKVCDPTKEICDGDECNPNLKCCEDCVEDFSKVIYRVINVDNPFTYENGKIRNTGINWCSETANDGKMDCSGNNKTVLSKITDKKNISESEALYVIDLTSDNIKSLRGYNENHSYEYYNCDKNVSDFCRSEILNGTSSSVRNLVIGGNCRVNYKTCTD